MPLSTPGAGMLFQGAAVTPDPQLWNRTIAGQLPRESQGALLRMATIATFHLAGDRLVLGAQDMLKPSLSGITSSRNHNHSCEGSTTGISFLCI
jgi:hypothetical protein